MAAPAFGCAKAPAKPALMAQAKRLDVGVAELRAKVYDFAEHVGTEVARCADEIMAQSAEADVERNALLWKMYAVPAARAAGFQHDPLAGLFDLWALTVQQRNWLSNGDGAGLFGAQSNCALPVAAQLSEEARALAQSSVKQGDVSAPNARVEAWAAQNPVVGELFVRRSTSSTLAEIAPAQSQTGLQAMGSLEELTRDLSDRINIVGETMPTEMRWQAEYLLDAMFEEYAEEPTEAAVATMARMDALLEGWEPFADEQVGRLLGAADQLRDTLLLGVQQTAESFKETADAQREALVSAAETKVDEQLEKLLSRFDETGRGLIDYFFVRALQFVAVVGFAFLLLFVWLRRHPEIEAAPEASPDAPGDED